MAKQQNVISVLNDIVRAELGGPKRHRHSWRTAQPLTRGTTVEFTCVCGESKSHHIPTIEERKIQLSRTHG